MALTPCGESVPRWLINEASYFHADIGTQGWITPSAIAFAMASYLFAAPSSLRIPSKWN